MPCPNCTPTDRCARCDRTAARTVVRIRSSWTRRERAAVPR